MTAESPILTAYQVGKLTVVGFGAHEVLDHVDLADCRREVLALVKQHACETLAFDLTGVRLIPSGLLGLLASLRKKGLEVHLYNPSRDVREVLEITKLDQLMPIHEIEA